MTKADIVNEISKKTGTERAIVQSTVEIFMESVKESLADNKNVYLRGFGSFIVKKRAKKTARNISKRTTLIIPAHFIPAFKPSKTFVKKVRNSVKVEDTPAKIKVKEHVKVKDTPVEIKVKEPVKIDAIPTEIKEEASVTTKK